MGRSRELLKLHSQQIDQLKNKPIEQRVENLERELMETQDLLATIVERLEMKFSTDIDGDSIIGQ